MPERSAQSALREAAIGKGSPIEQDAGWERHTARGSQCLTLGGVERDNLDGHGVFLGEPVKESLSLIAEPALALGEEGHMGHDRAIPACMFAVSWLIDTYMV